MPFTPLLREIFTLEMASRSPSSTAQASKLKERKLEEIENAGTSPVNDCLSFKVNFILGYSLQQKNKKLTCSSLCNLINRTALVLNKWGLKKMKKKKIRLCNLHFQAYI